MTENLQDSELITGSFEKRKLKMLMNPDRTRVEEPFWGSSAVDRWSNVSILEENFERVHS